MAPTTAQAAKAAPVANDPFADLQAKKKELTQLQGQAAQIQATVQAKQAEVQKLEGFLGDTDKVVQAYAAGLPKLAAELKAMGDLAALHKKEVEAVLGAAKMKAIADVIAKVDAGIAYQKKAAEDAESTAGEKQKAADEAAAGLKRAESKLAEWKRSLAALEEAVKPLRVLRENEAKADASEVPGSDEKKALFVLQLEESTALLKPIQPDELRGKLVEALESIEQWKTKTDQSKADTTAAKKSADEKRKAFDAAAASRIDAILAEVAKL